LGGTQAVLRRLPRRERRSQVAVPDPARRGRRDHRGNDARSRDHQREDRSEEVRSTEMNALLALMLAAQTAAVGTLHITILDQTNAVVVGATVTVTGADDATRRVTVAPVRTIDTGVAIIPALPLGRYTIDVEFPGFEKRTLPDVRIRAGDNRQVAVLAIGKIE